MIPRLARILLCRPFLTSIVFLGLLTAQACMADIRLSQPNGEALTLPDPAERIVTLAPNLAELVFAAGAGTQLVAVVEYSNYPAEVVQLPRVGDAFRIDLESILEFEPNLVIAWKSGNPQSALQKLSQLGIRVWQIEITKPGDIARTVEEISRAAGTEAEGMLAARRLQEKLLLLQRQNSGKTPVEYFYQIASRPLYTINDQHIISRSLEICGGINVFSGLAALAPQISRESVIVADPTVMIAPVTSGEKPALNDWREWPRLQAVKADNMIYLPADEISQATPRLLDSIELACKRLDEVRRRTEQP